MTPEQQADTDRRNLRRAAAWAGWALARFVSRWRLARHTITPLEAVSAFRGIDRSVAPTSLQWNRPSPPLTFEAFQEAARAAIAYRPPPPFKPWITHANAAQLVVRGISIERIAELFTIID